MQTETGKKWAEVLNPTALDEIAGWAETAAATLKEEAKEAGRNGSTFHLVRPLLDDADTFKQLAAYARRIHA